MRQIDIDQAACLGLHRCARCEEILPGLHGQIANGGPLLVNDWAYREHERQIARMITRCPAKAVSIAEMEGGMMEWPRR